MRQGLHSRKSPACLSQSPDPRDVGLSPDGRGRSSLRPGQGERSRGGLQRTLESRSLTELLVRSKQLEEEFGMGLAQDEHTGQERA